MSDAVDRARAFTEALKKDEVRVDQAPEVLEKMTPLELVQAITIMGTVGPPYGHLLAQASGATLSRRLNESLIVHLDKLDASNGRLTQVGWLLALVGIFVAVVDVLVELKYLS